MQIITVSFECNTIFLQQNPSKTYEHQEIIIMPYIDKIINC